MKRAVAVLFFIAAVSTVGIGIASARGGGGMTPAAMQYSTKQPSAYPNADTVFGGGHFTAFLNSHNFSVTATGNGGGTLVYSQGQILAQITCTNISGNVAVVGGFIVSTTGPAPDATVTMYFVDNGQPSGTSVGGDEVSPIMIASTTGAPKSCPAADTTGVPLEALDAGDIAVHAKGA